MKKLKLLVVEDRAVNLKHAKAVAERYKDRLDAVLAEDFATAEGHLRAGGISGMLTDIFFPYAKGSGRIETRLFEESRPHCFNADSAAVDLLAKILGEDMREPLARGEFKAEELERFIIGKYKDGNLPLGDMCKLIGGLEKIEYRGVRDDTEGSPAEWKRELDSVDADLKSGDETRQPCGILTMRLAHEMGIPFIAVSSLHAGHGSSASPVMRLLESELGAAIHTVETGGYGHRGSTEESEQQGHVKDENVWLKALVGLLEKIEKADSGK